ncbi:histidinol-phosphate transaminase [Aliiglaciecola lipolytica]|uniref:histidinol-phosphate transaminase n=1 Tax=Aliiglaciecola lipolytica TaxID=477689 RepID=UPI001C08D65D|nr:histidinol-phosphate transaminase [Aliiglaciecola lipolytica]MBU2877033.1 histidinol-phosphate transaminase [Aliiglaciecola lipolytica]
MSNLVEKLLCDNVRSLKPYESARRLFAAGSGEVQQTWLNANESPFANNYDVDSERFNRYPDCQPTSVINSYAAYSKVAAENTLVSRGADEGIELLIRAFCTPAKDAILICPPTYGMYAISAETFNVGVHKAPLNDDFSLDVESICAHKDKVKLVFICSPNNPTGTSVDSAQLQQVVEHFADSALVVVDEAYIEFDWHSTWANKLATYPNLVILRTLSKAFALAGIRCGFTLAAPAVIQALLKVIAPYPIPEPVAQIAKQALQTLGIDRMKLQVSELNAQRALLKERLMSIPSVELVGDDKANFILFRCEQKQELMQYLVDNHTLIRDQSKQINLQNCLRITVGTAEQNQQLMDLIFSFFKKQESAQ